MLRHFLLRDFKLVCDSVLREGRWLASLGQERE